MKILILGDVMGSSGRKAINKKLPNIIKKRYTSKILNMTILKQTQEKI